MEPIFEIRYYVDGALLTEFYRKLGTARIPRWLNLLLAIAVVWSTILSVVMQTLTDILPMLLIWVLATLWLALLPRWISWITLRNVKKQNDGRLPEDIITADDQIIRLEEGSVAITLEYRKIQRVVHLKHSYVLMNGKHTGIMLNPESFTKGTFGEFKAFLREKRPDLTIPE